MATLLHRVFISQKCLFWLNKPGMCMMTMMMIMVIIMHVTTIKNSGQPPQISVSNSTAARKFLTNYLCRKLSYTLQEIFVILYILECHIIYLLFKNSKNVLQVEIVLCRDLSLSQCAASYVLWNLHMQEVLYLTYSGNVCHLIYTGMSYNLLIV
jgi:hypothetical protein